METIHSGGKYDLRISSSNSPGSRTSSRFPFERLPLKSRLRIYNELVPEAIIFRGRRHGTRSQWPENPLGALAVCYFQFQEEIDLRLYSKTRFIFYDSRNRGVKTYGYETAARFFSCIGPLKLSYINHIYCHFHWTSFCAKSAEVFDMLSLMASSDPPRNVRRLDLSFTKTRHVKPFKSAGPISRPCFVLNGFIGVKITLVFPNTKEKMSVDELNTWIAAFRDPGPPVNFLTTLPAELRNEIFRYLVPRVCSSLRVRRRQRPNIPGWVSVNRQMSVEICSVMYGECQFEFHIPSGRKPNRHQSEDSRFVSFLRRIGSTNARQIRSVGIFLQIYPGLPNHLKVYTPPISGILRAINKRCHFRIRPYSIPASLVPDGSTDRYQFRYPTRAGRTLVVHMQMEWHSGFSPRWTTNNLDNWAAMSLRNSSNGIRSFVP